MDVNDTHILIVDDDKDYALELKKSFVEIEKLSLYLIQNEFIIARAKQLRHEQLEVFCAD